MYTIFFFFQWFFVHLVYFKSILFRKLGVSRPPAGRRPGFLMCRPAAGRPQTKFVVAGRPPAGRRPELPAAGRRRPQNSEICPSLMGMH